MSARARLLRAKLRLRPGRLDRSLSVCTCERTGKRSYASREDAATVAASFSREESFRGQRVYRCEFCRLWHLTSRLGGAA